MTSMSRSSKKSPGKVVMRVDPSSKNSKGVSTGPSEESWQRQKNR